MATVDPENTPTTTESEGMSATELEEMIGKVIDARLEPITAKLDSVATPDLEAFRTSLMEDVTGIITANKSTPVDEEGLLTKIGAMVDAKMAGLSATTVTQTAKRVGGPLSRWLGIGNA